VIVPRHFLIAILHTIAKIRRNAAACPRLPPLPEHAPIAGRPPGLFTHATTDQGPYEDERIALGAVEDLATTVDTAQAKASTEADHARVSDMRRQLLDRLEFYGLLDEIRAPEKRAYLEGFRLPRLRDYMDAAIALRAYYRSPTRAQYLGAPAPQRLLDGSVSLDWFRLPTATPAGETPEGWLALAEHLVQEAPPSGASGEIFASVGDRRYPTQR
jgi:hypothetical protein